MPPKNPLNAELLKACAKGDLVKVTQSVDGGANVNAKSPGKDESPLFIAVSKNNKPIVEYLLTKGANVDTKNGPNGYTAFLQACLNGSLDIATVLANAGANINLKSNNGFTPLYKAIEMAHSSIVDFLLAKGANLEEKNGPDGRTALIAACIYDYLGIAKALVNAGANINEKSTRGYTPLVTAAVEGIGDNNRIVKYLLKKGANLEEKNGEYGHTALTIACYNGLLDIVKILVDGGANVNMKSTEGFSPLYFACQNKHPSIVAYLLTKGVDLEEKNGPDDNTAIQKAAYEGFLKIVKMLKNAGADITGKDKNGKSALDFAIEHNHQDVVEYLESFLGQKPQGPEPAWTGFTQIDISKFDTIFETEAPPGELPPAVNYSCCPVCLKYAERSEACMYMTHKCNGYYNKKLYNKYKNSDGLICWCTICGRICFGHRHYTKTFWDAEKPALLPSGDPFENDCKKTSGGGGVEEKLARFRALRNTALDLQAGIDAGESYTMSQAMDELVQQCWNAAPGLVTKRIMTQKKWNRPSTNFLPNAPPAAHVYPNDDPSAYEAPRILKPGNANFSANTFTGDDSEPVIQFRHKKSDGTMFTHPLLNKDTLLMFLESSGPDWPCFEPSCGGHLWPAEVIQALDNPALVATPEEKAKAQAYKVRVHGPSQNAGRRRKTHRRRR